MYLGKGTYGVVEKHGNVARKTFNHLSHIIQEYCALAYLEDCNYIVHAKHVNFEKLQLDMDLYDMSLREWIVSGCKCTKCVDKIIHDILCGLVEVQDLCLAHADIKPGNILICKKPLKAVLGDCGFVSICEYAKQQRTAPAYRDPKVKNDDKHDIFSFALCVMELKYKVRPRLHDDYKDIDRIINKYVKDTKYNHLLKRMLHHNRDERPCAREVLYLLYGEKPQNNYEKIDYKETNEYITTHMRKYSEELDINRAPIGRHALIYYINKHHINKKQYKLYIAATLAILSSVFGKNKETIKLINQHIFGTDDCDNLLPMIKKLTKDKEFIKILFAFY